jgi:hypothetical protein
LPCCTDFATPAELTKPTILAVTADPPIVAPGASADLTTVVVDGSGVIAGLTQRQMLVETYPGVPPMGRLEVEGDTVRYIAPDPVPPLPENAPALDSVQIDIETPDAVLRTVKVMGVQAGTFANPVLARFTVNGVDALTATAPITLARNAAVTIDVAIDPPATDMARFAWYSSAGLIEKYQSTPTELVAAEVASQGWLYVVVRDGALGVVWRGVEIVVE